MKKITFIAMLMLSAFSATAQNFYNFTKLEQTYADLENTVSINQGLVWDYDDFAPVTLPFAFTVMGQQVDRFLFADDGFVLLAPGVSYNDDSEGIYYLNTSNLYIQDRTASTQISSSPISYKIEGAAGSRILKLEVKNASIEDADAYGYEEDYFYMNYQIWLYEEGKIIEFHYGIDNITDLDNLTDGDGLLAGFGDDYGTVGFVYGDISNPSYIELTEDTIEEPVLLNDYPTSGTVYRFAPAQAAGLPSVKNNVVSLYPNPAKSVLTIISNSTPVSQYSIYDATGKQLQQKSINAAPAVNINVENLATGIYFVDVNGQHLKFVKN
jgi:hypothetical protein